MATYYKRDSGTNWNANASWSTVAYNSATNTGTFPVAGDTAYFVNGSANCTINVASACAILDMTGYTNTLTFTSTLVTTSTVTLGGTLAGAGVWTMNTSCTINTNSVTITGGLTLAGASQTYTLNGALSVTGALLLNGTTLCTIATAGNNITVGGLTTIGVNTTMTGAGTLSGNTMTQGNFTLTLASNWTMSSTLTLTNAGATFVGAYTITPATLVLISARTLPDANLVFTHLQSSGVVITLASDVSVTDYTITGAPSINGVGKTLNIGGNLTMSTFQINGTAALKLNGTGTWSGSSVVGLNNTGGFTIDTAGTITVSGSVAVSCGLFTMTAGTLTGGLINFASTTAITQTGGTIASDFTFNAFNYYFASNVTTSGALTFSGSAIMNGGYTLSCANITINASCIVIAGTNFTLTGNWTNNGTYKPYTPNTVTFDGTSTVAGATDFFNLTINAGRTVSFTSTQTYKIYGTFTATGTGVSGITINSTTGGSAATLLFQNDSAFTGDYITFQDIAATGNAPIRTGANVTLTSGNSGIAYYANPTLVITSNRTIQELYDYYSANRSSSTKLSETDFFTTADGVNYLCSYNMIVDNCVLSGAGKKLNLGSNTFSAINGGSTTAIVTDVSGTIVPVTGVGLLASSLYEVYKTSDGTVLGSGTTGGTTFSFSYTHTADLGVTLVVRKFGYLEARYTGTITANGLEFNVSQVADPNTASYPVGIASDFTIDTTAFTITHTSGSTIYTVRELYNYTMDYFASLSPDRMQKLLPMSAQTPTNFTLQNSYTMDDTTHEYLKTGAITEDGGDTLWSNLYTVGTQVASTTMYIVQNGTKLTGWWSTGNIDVLVKVKTGGSLIDSGYVTVFARKYATLYDHNRVDLSGGGRTAIAIATSSDANNQTASGTVAGYSDIAKTEGVDDYDIGDGLGAQPYSVKFDCAGRTVEQVYEYLKYVTRETSTYTIDSIEGEQYTTINGAYTEIKTAPFGTFAGGTFYGAKGVWLENIATADALNYVLTDNNGVTHQSPAPPVAISVSGLVAGSRVQIYNVTDDTELFNDVVAGTSTSYTYAHTANKTIRIRAKYTAAASAYLMYETTGTFISTGLAVTANQVLDTTYATNGVDGSGVTECSVSGATIRIYVDDPDNVTTFQRIYNWYQYVLFTSGGIADQDTDYFFAISPVEYRFDPTMKIVNQDTVNPLTINGANIAPTSGTASIIDNSNGASTVIYSYFPVDASGNLANLDAPVSDVFAAVFSKP